MMAVDAITLFPLRLFHRMSPLEREFARRQRRGHDTCGEEANCAQRPASFTCGPPGCPCRERKKCHATNAALATKPASSVHGAAATSNDAAANATTRSVQLSGPRK